MHKVQTVETWIKRICRYCPVATITIEKVKFDTQKLENPNIQGVEYQQGTLAGYTIREALLEHWGRKCAYCGVQNVPLQIEHIKPKSEGGSNRFSNLTLACECCNKSKGNKSREMFLSDKPEILQKIKSHVKQSLSDAAANSINEKPIKLLTHQPLLVTCKGHGNRQAVRCNNSGFPAITLKRDSQGKKVVKMVKPKQVYHHASAGDIVKIRVDKDRKHISKGVYIARVKTPTKTGIEVKINGHRITSKLYHFLHRNDGYDYNFGKMLSI